MYDMQTLHAGGIPMFRGTYLVLNFFLFASKTIGFFHYVLSMAMPNMKLIGEFMTARVRDATSFLSIFLQNDRQRPFCFSDWCQNSQGSCNLGPQWLWRIWILLVYLWQSYGLYKRWQPNLATIWLYWPFRLTILTFVYCKTLYIRAPFISLIGKLELFAPLNFR